MVDLRRRAALAAAVFFLAAGNASAGRPLTVSDIAKLVDLEQPAISPDGKRIALLVIRQNETQARYDSELVLVDAASAAVSHVASGSRIGDPRWSPDGSQLAYLAPDPSTSRMQVFVRAGRAAARQATHALGDVVDFAYRPDGRAIAYAAYEPVDRQAVRGHHTLFEVGENDYTLTARPRPIHLWLREAGGSERRLTSGSWTIPPTDSGGIFTPQFAWRGSTQLVYAAAEDVFSGRNERTTIWSIDTSTLRRTKLTDRDRFEVTPQVVPHSGDVSYWYPRDGDYDAQTLVHLRSGDRDEILSGKLDLNVGGSVWMPDGRSLLICADEGATTPMWLIARDGTAAKIPTGGLNVNCEPYSDGEFDAGIAASVSNGGTIAFTARDAKHAIELYTVSAPGAAPRRLTRFNDVLAGRDLGTMREVTWTGPGGFKEDGVLTFPPNMEPGKKYPLVVQVHGGPEEAITLSFPPEVWPRTQLLAGHGYVVFEPNYRGSDNLGDAYQRAWVTDASRGPASDILAGLDAIAREPAIDMSRIAVEGYSEGGLLTSWLITQDHRWRAAVSGAAPNDLIESYNLSVSNVQDAYYQGGRSPYAGDGASAYTSASPITFAAQVTTPTLIWSATGDPVVPIPMSYGFFRALRDNHVPVKFLAFPAGTHGPDNPVSTADLTSAIFGWLDRYMR